MGPHTSVVRAHIAATGLASENEQTHTNGVCAHIARRSDFRCDFALRVV